MIRRLMALHRDDRVFHMCGMTSFWNDLVCWKSTTGYIWLSETRDDMIQILTYFRIIYNNNERHQQLYWDLHFWYVYWTLLSKTGIYDYNYFFNMKLHIRCFGLYSRICTIYTYIGIGILHIDYYSLAETSACKHQCISRAWHKKNSMMPVQILVLL